MSRDLIASALLATFGLGAIALTQPIAPLQAQPARGDAQPESAGTQRQAPPIVARVRTREGVIDLTRESVAVGGKAAHLRESVGQVIADVVVPADASR